MTWCVYCRSTIPDDAAECPSCGKPLSDGAKVVRCPSCGKYILKKTERCIYCGGDTRAPAPAEQPATPTEQPALVQRPAPEAAAPVAKENAPTEQPASGEAIPVQQPASDATAPDAQSAPPKNAPASAQPAPAAKPSSSAKAAQKAARKKRKWPLLVLIAVLAAGLFFGVRALFFKKDNATETQAEYIASCKAVPYALVSRDPKHYEGERLTFSGTVTELVAGSTITLHIEQMTLDAAPGSDIWYAAYTPSSEDALIPREGDEITVYGECAGAETYALQPGETVTIPSLRILYCERAELDKLRASQDNAFGLNETWTIDGLCSVTVTGVSRTKDRNPDTKKSPVVVYYVDYTYVNLGYESETADGIYVAIDETILDSAGKVGYSYPNSVKNEPRPTPVGETCEARCCVGLDHAGPFQLTVNVIDPDLNAYTARFNIPAE